MNDQQLLHFLSDAKEQIPLPLHMKRPVIMPLELISFPRRPLPRVGLLVLGLSALLLVGVAQLSFLTGNVSTPITETPAGSFVQAQNPIIDQDNMKLMPGADFSTFEDLQAYLNGDFKKSNEETFYLVKPQLAVTWYNQVASFHVNYLSPLSSNTSKNPIVTEHYLLYDPLIGDCRKNTSTDTGFGPFSAYLTFSMKATQIDEKTDFTFSFESLEGDYSEYRYINIYANGREAGTCYLRGSKKITNHWITNYLKNSLCH